MTSQEHLVQMLRKRGPCEEQRQRQPFEWQRSLAPKITFGTKWIHSEIFFLERVSSHFDTFGKKTFQQESRRHSERPHTFWDTQPVPSMSSELLGEMVAVLMRLS